MVAGPAEERIKRVLHEIAAEYPADLHSGQRADIDRIAFNIGLVVARTREDARVCDIGGGVGMFSVGCAALGMTAHLVDDFNDTVNKLHGEDMLALHKQRGVHVIRCDVVSEPLDLETDSFDAITSFDSMEHWHNSPKSLFHRLTGALAPGGIFVVGVPNCVNLRKRLSVPLGSGKWSSMDDWYEEPVFRGHVREPDVADLQYIARDLGLRNVEIIGRNWLGYHSRIGLVRRAMPLADRLLSRFPTLCADLCMIGRKPT